MFTWMIDQWYQFTFESHHNMVNFLENMHDRHPMAPLLGVQCVFKDRQDCHWVTPVYLGWLNVFVLVRTPVPPLPPPPAAKSCSRDNFWTTFQISLIFGRIDGPDLWITWLDFGRFSFWPWYWIFKVKYGIWYISAKNGPVATKQKANISIEL